MEAFIVKQPLQAQVEETDVPEPAGDEVLIEVKAAGLCGTDVHIFAGEFDASYPVIPGHEFAGIVVSAGKDVVQFKPGDRVAADPNISCGNCYYCRQNMQNHCLNFQALGVTRQGAFAEYLPVPERVVFDIGKINFEEAAMVEPLACVAFGQERARPGIGGNVLIFGAGPIGLLHLQLAKHNGAAEVAVVDLKQDRLQLAATLGADHTVVSDPEKPEELHRRLKEIAPYGFTTVIDCTGVPKVVETGIGFVGRGGQMLLFGVCPNDSTISVDPFHIYRHDISLIGSFALKKNFQTALNLIRTGSINVKALIGDRVTLDELPGAIQDMQAGKARMKVVVCR